MSQRIVIAGGSGFIGHTLTAEFLQRGYQIVILTRTPGGSRRDGVREAAWDGKNLGEWRHWLDGAHAVINLTGKNINCPHTPENLRVLTASRVDSVNILATAIREVAAPPRVWVQAGAIGFYGDTQDRLCDETSPVGEGALADICAQWEAAFTTAEVPATRKAVLRIGFVLGGNGGALPILSRLTKLFLGGAAGNGRQYICWIHLADLVQMFVTVVERERLAGIFNAVAPSPVTNAEFMRELRRVLRRPWCPPAPKFAVRIGSALMGSEAGLVLMSSRCTPDQFHTAEFKYQFPKLTAALKNIC